MSRLPLEPGAAGDARNFLDLDGIAARPITAAVAAMGGGALTADALARHVAPLFSRVLSRNAGRIYLANHSLGRPLDATLDDVAEAVCLWQDRVGDAWEGWSAEIAAYRRRLARLIGAPREDCVVPKTSAGQGLRAILNSYEAPPRVVATRSEFDSLDVILRQYARRARISLSLVDAREDGQFAAQDLRTAIRAGSDLVVISQVMFNSGQALPELEDIVADAHASGARVLLDVYHSVGVFAVDVNLLDVDFAVGGAYKYLRGGPGACYLYLHPRHLDGSLQTLDVGWFAKRAAFSYQRPEPPELGEGGDAFLESTPPVLTYYQARAGQVLTLAIGVERLREYSLRQQQTLLGHLSDRGVTATGGTPDRGAFVTVRTPRASLMAAALAERDVRTDARGEYLRLCPDILTTPDEIMQGAEKVAAVAASL
jgi:kynureninase